MPRAPELASDGSWIALGMVEVVVVAVGEESIFRGILHRGLRTRYPVALAAVSSAALFAIVHSYPPFMPAIFLVGVALALATEWRKVARARDRDPRRLQRLFVVQGYLT